MKRIYSIAGSIILIIGGFVLIAALAIGASYIPIPILEPNPDSNMPVIVIGTVKLFAITSLGIMGFFLVGSIILSFKNAVRDVR